MLGPGERWEATVTGQLGPRVQLEKLFARIRQRLLPGDPDALSLRWMPAAHYARFWPRMRAFALPAYYDGQIRINLRGRERGGLVPIEDYARTCDEIEELLRECRDPIRGASVISSVERASGSPLELGPHEADLTVVWKDAPLGLDHPRLGKIGPLPYRRTGGHTGGDGFAWMSGPLVRPGSGGRRSAFDVVPTVIELLGQPPLAVSGRSFAGLASFAAPERELVESD
jgi:hypothetical protein